MEKKMSPQAKEKCRAEKRNINRKENHKWDSLKFQLFLLDIKWRDQMDTLCKEMHGVTDFINSNFNCLQEYDNGIVFKELYFETRFHKFAFSGPQNTVVM